MMGRNGHVLYQMYVWLGWLVEFLIEYGGSFSLAQNIYET